MENKKLWLVKYADATIHIDDYNKGELDNVNNFQIEDLYNKTFESLQDIINIVNQYFGCEYEKKFFAYFDGNKYPELVTDILVDKDNQYVDKERILYKQWVKGEITLYNAYVSIGLTRIVESIPSEKDFEDEGI